MSGRVLAKEVTLDHRPAVDFTTGQPLMDCACGLMLPGDSYDYAAHIAEELYQADALRRGEG